MNPSSDMECAVVTKPIDFLFCSLSVPLATREVPPIAGRVGYLGTAEAD
jgi:hypothetical protein